MQSELFFHLVSNSFHIHFAMETCHFLSFFFFWAVGRERGPQKQINLRWLDLHSELSVGFFFLPVTSSFYCQLRNGNFSVFFLLGVGGVWAMAGVQGKVAFGLSHFCIEVFQKKL